MTRDAFHRGRFHLVQPATGHRSGIDAMILAAALPSGFSGHAADLGAGAGAASLALLSRCAQATATLVENDPVMIEAARQTLALAENRPLAERAGLVEADVTLRGQARIGAGLPDDGFDAAILNPPFNGGRDRPSPDMRRAAAHVAGPGLFGDWLRTACAITRPGGLVALIARPESLRDILEAIGGRLGGLALKPVHSHQAAPAIRIVLRGIKGSRARLAIHPPLVLHEGEGKAGEQPFTAEADRINNGLAALFGD